jgi:hypothetical protein
VTESREREPESSGLPAGDVESPQVAASEGGWAGRETAGRGQDRDRERRVSREEWMAYLLEQAPEITPEQWEETVAALVALRPLRGKGPQKPGTQRDGAGPGKRRSSARDNRRPST